MVSKEMQNVIKILNESQASVEKERIKETRTNIERALSFKVPKDVKCERVEVRGVPAEWITTPDVEKNHVILYLHGGGYVCGSINTHRDLVARISRVSNARILIINYRLAPENKFPAALDDAITTYQWLIDVEGITPDNLIIAGDSAGGGLTIASLVYLRDKGIALPAAAICLSPWTDLELTGESFKTNLNFDPLITPENLTFDARLYLGDADYKNPLASPLYANLQGLPPLFIQVGTSEMIFDDSVRLAEHAKKVGVDVELDIWPDMIHAFQLFAKFAPEGRQAIDRIGFFAKKFLR